MKGSKPLFLNLDEAGVIWFEYKEILHKVSLESIKRFLKNNRGKCPSHIYTGNHNFTKSQLGIWRCLCKVAIWAEHSKDLSKELDTAMMEHGEKKKL